MAIGDRISSARTCDFMRRINRLEYNTSSCFYSHTGALTNSADLGSSTVDVNSSYITGDDVVFAKYVGTSDPVIRKIGKDLTGISTIASTGVNHNPDITPALQLYTPLGFYANSSGAWYMSDSSPPSVAYHVFHFSLAGSLLGLTYPADGTFPNRFVPGAIGADESGTSYTLTIRSAGLYLYKYSSSMVEQASLKLNDKSVATNESLDQKLTVNKDGQPIVRANMNLLYADSITSHVFDSSLSELYDISNDLLASTGSAGSQLISGTDLMVSGNRIGSALSGETICSYTRPLASAHIDGDDFKAYGINHVSTSEYRISHTPLDSTTGGTQTTWYQYPTPATDTGKITLGTPNAGLSVPTDTALQGLRPHYFELRDMRDAIESVALDYENPATATAYTLTVGTDNIFRIAIDSGQDDWTTATVTHKDRIREDYYSDIESVLTQLEQSALA